MPTTTATTRHAPPSRPAHVATHAVPLQIETGTGGDGETLVRRAQRGELGAYEALYHLHAGRVHALCLRLTGDRERARELTQDVFVRAWERLGSFAGASAFTSWLHRLTVNVVLERVRTDKRRAHRVTYEGDSADGRTIDGAAPAAAMSAEERIDFERAVAALPPGLRTVYVLHDIEGYRHGEIAQLTGTAEGTTRAQLHQARRKLMEMLAR